VALVAALALLSAVQSGGAEVPAQTPAPGAAPAPAVAPPSPRQLFDARCQTCHGNAETPRAADPAILRRMTPEHIYAALTTGVMQPQADGLSDAERRGIAEYLGDRKLGAGPIGDAAAMPNRCTANPPIPVTALDGPTAAAWNGWGADLANTRFQSAGRAGLTAADIPRLRVKWAFGFPGATAVYGQPAIAAGRVFAGADTGYVYALDAASGCVHWGFQAQAGVRSAVTLGRFGDGGSRWAVWFGDMKGNVYALDARTGAQIWRIAADDHALTRITAAVVLHAGRLYVPVTSFEEGAATSPRYPCCTFRGSVMAVDAATGRTIWKTYTIAGPPVRTGVNASGTPRFGPSGAGVWTTPTIDPVRNALYVGTGNAYSRPVPNTTDAVIAFALDTGRMLWVQQLRADDVWIPGCPAGSTAGNCPERVGPDYDVGASPVLTAAPGGRRLLISAQKSGQLWAHDPDRAGALVWKADPPGAAPAGPEGEMVWGIATDGNRVFAGLTSGGVAAYDVATGTRVWTTAIAAAAGRRGGHSGAVSAMPGVVLSAGWDGVMRALAAGDGRVLWTHDTMTDFQTVNGVPGRGGSMGAPGPTVAGGMVFAGSGYIGVRSGTPGNVLIAYAVESGN
jgi:polyvinyl alcohol dehydrogenase (cytochrome)